MEKIALDIRNLSVSYGKNTVLKNLDLAVPKNRITAIIGGSGCGKSTLLKAVNRTAEEYGAKVSGTVTLDGEDAFSLPAETLRRRIGMVFQTPVTFPFTIYKNMLYAPKYFKRLTKAQADELVSLYLKKAGLYEEVKDQLGMPATRLSGGQQQRLAIARCLTVEPEILLLDEPCSALDVKNTAHIEKLLLELKADYTILIVTHNLAQARRIADAVIYMEDGEIIESGTPTELFGAPKDERTKAYLAYLAGN
jgi:phosphate transport system ATP-binding protein